MTDARLRDLERRFVATGALADEAALLAERVRAGRLAPARLRLAAALGHPAAEGAALGVAVAPAAVSRSSGWFAGLARLLLGDTPSRRSTATRREPHPEDYPEVRPLPLDERARRRAGSSGPPHERLAALLRDGVLLQPKALLRNVDEAVFDAAAACGSDGLLRVALAAVRCASDDLLASEVAAHARDDPRALVTAGELDRCREVLALAEGATRGPWPRREARALMRSLEEAVERNRRLVRGIRLTGPDLGYTTRWIVACYLLADLLAVDEPDVQRGDTRDVVSHAEGYFLELWTPHDRNTVTVVLDDAIVTRAATHVAAAVRAAVVPWALGEGP